ncbi:hypothetical protein INT47_005686 [Mucor saturninus]|uniref:Histone H1 n=1 Tax=Mucor saturninus TaxID=64648 RepID=A0A8H7QJS0_9FUNG|nr:hypothetical protein INT47_005686 [Mucor saturninus]
MAETKVTSKKNHATYQQMISGAISSLKERNGSSRPAIKKYILANYGLTGGTHFDAQISAAIRRGVEKGIFAIPKGISGTIKLVKPEKKTSTASAKKTTNVKKVTDEKSLKKVAPVKKSAPVKKAMKRVAAENVEPVKKARKAPTVRVNKPNVAA